MTKKKNYRLEMDSVTLSNGKKYPLMNVTISGIPGLGTIREMMKDIDEMSKKLDTDYISVTDFRELKISKFLQRIILFGMEATYKKMLSVSNPSKLSFVILPEKDEGSSFLKQSLEEINENSDDKSYQYRYIFVNDTSDIKNITTKLIG